MQAPAERTTADDGEGVDGGLPPLIDVADALDRIERTTANEDAKARLTDIRVTLGRIAARDPDRRESLLSDLAGLADDLRTHVGGEADSWAESVQNRVDTHRRTRRESSDTLHFENSRLTVDGEAPVDPTEHRGEKATLRGTLVNLGEPGHATVRLAFYDEDDAATRTVESAEFHLDAGECRDLDLHVWIPADAAYYGITALDPSNARTTDRPPVRS
ncbi:MAG: hypothetical protein ABEJ05_13010 [Haloglomus sp.]